VNKIEKPVIRDDRGRWLPGSGSPSPGRPPSSRQRISERLIADIADVWERHGQAVLERLAKDDPKALAQITYGLLPRDIFVQVQNTGSLDSDDRRMLLDLLDVVKEAGAEGNSPELVLQWIAEDLRARLAVPIERK
jgi:hypothetical protein